MRTFARLGLLGGFVLGCSSARPAPTAAPAATAVTRLTLPRVFTVERTLTLRVNDARDLVALDANLPLLRAPEAPAVFTVRLRPPRVCGAFDGALHELAIEGGEGGPVRVEVRDGALAVQALRDGVADVFVRGTYVHGPNGCDDGLAAGARLPVRARLRIEAREDPGRPQLGGALGCRSGAFAGAQPQVPLNLELRDASDAPLSFVNLAPRAPFEVRVEAEIDVTIPRVGELLLAERPGQVRLRAAAAPAAWVWRWRVPPAEITDAAVRFYVPGNAGSPVDVTEGAQLGGANRKLGGVFFEVREASVREGPLCDRADARWFQLISETPEVCPVVAVRSQACDGCAGPHYGHQAARLRRDGVCTVRLEAPALDHGRGFVRRVSASFQGVVNFPDVFPTLE